mgnify:CR=1 FL=1
MLITTPSGLFCPDGGFHVDPWGAADLAIITHAHADHARFGARRYLTAGPGRLILAHRLAGQTIESLAYGESRRIGGVTVSLHPAGHVLGSAQVRIERAGEVWVVSGDYKVEADGVCEPFAPVRCHRFISECTFGLPIYRWQPQAIVAGEINSWWRSCRERARTAVLGVYSLGKAQRVLSMLQGDDAPILVHGAVAPIVELHRAAGVRLPPTLPATKENAAAFRGRAFVLAPPSALASPWLRSFGEVETGLASGWMRVRGTRRRSGIDRGFVLSDHADWPGLLAAIDATGCAEVGLTHGFVDPLRRWFDERGMPTTVYQTKFTGEDAEGGAEAGAAAPAEGST